MAGLHSVGMLAETSGPVCHKDGRIGAVATDSRMSLKSTTMDLECIRALAKKGRETKSTGQSDKEFFGRG